jgi:hypothetical protein
LIQKHISVTPTLPLADKPTWFFESEPTGGAVFNVGNFLKPASTNGDQSIAHGLPAGIALKALIIWTSGDSSDGTVTASTSAQKASFGVSDLTSTGQRGIGWNSNDASSGGAVASIYGTKAINLVNYASGSVLITGSVSYSGGSNFTITWAGNGSDSTQLIFHFLAIGGNDVQAKVSGFTFGSTASTTVTGVGFQPDLLILGARGGSAVDTRAETLQCSIGVADAAGNEWTTAWRCGDSDSPHQAESAFFNEACAEVYYGSSDYVIENLGSMNSDGYTLNRQAGTQATAGFGLALRGLQALVGVTQKPTASGNHGALSIGFTTQAFFLAGCGKTNVTGNVSADGAIYLGAASSTTAVEASSWIDRHNVATTDVNLVADTALAYEILSNTGVEAATATCGSIDMQAANWLSWTDASDGQARYIGFLGLAATAVSDVSFLYHCQGRHVTKLKVEGSPPVITQIDAQSFSIGAEARYGAIFEGTAHLPLGDSVNAVALQRANISQTGADTWTTSGSGFKCRGFAVQQDGPLSKLVRANVDGTISLSADASTYAGTVEVGDSSIPITRIADSGTVLLVAKEDNLYRYDPSGVAWAVTAENERSPNHGVGLAAFHGASAGVYNHGSTLFFWDGFSRPRSVGMDENAFARPEAVTGITHVPVGGTIYESVIRGDYLYYLQRVTESGEDVTYVICAVLRGAQWVRHTAWRLSGTARGLYIDSSTRLWTSYISAGQIRFWQLGDDGGPTGYVGNGRGEASTTFTYWGAETDLGAPVTAKRLWQYVVLLRNVDATCPVQLKIQRDGGNAEDVGSPVTTDGVYKAYWSVGGGNNTAIRVRLGWSITTTSGYDPLLSDPQVLVLGIQAYSLHDTAGVYQIIIDTEVPHGQDRASFERAQRVRTRLLQLTEPSTGPVVCKDPDGNTVTFLVRSVSDLLLRGPDVNNVMNYLIQLDAVEWTEPANWPT